MEWEEMFSGKSFITDLGEKQSVEKDGNEIELGQYAVWLPFKGASHHKIVEVGEDLSELMKKYNISSERVCVLQR